MNPAHELPPSSPSYTPGAGESIKARQQRMETAREAGLAAAGQEGKEGWSTVDQVDGRGADPAMTGKGGQRKKTVGWSKEVERLQRTRCAVQRGVQTADVDKGRGLGGRPLPCGDECAECSPRGTQHLRKAH